MRERHYPVNEAALSVDKGAERDARARPCCKRVEGAWCVLPTGHGGPNIVPPPAKDSP